MEKCTGMMDLIILYIAVNIILILPTNYKGYWLQGAPHGKGKMVYSDGSSKFGLFDNNKLIKEFKEIELIKEVSELHETDH